MNLMIGIRTDIEENYSLFQYLAALNRFDGRDVAVVIRSGRYKDQVFYGETSEAW